MPYVIKVITTGGVVKWLTRTGSNGLRSADRRDMAEIFPGVDEAKAAVDSMPRQFAAGGVAFSVEDSDDVS
jgi:hypothetical protein